MIEVKHRMTIKNTFFVVKARLESKVPTNLDVSLKFHGLYI